MEIVETVAALLDRPAWQRYAACRGIDPDLFFPSRGEPVAPPKAVCGGCLVRQECLAFALVQREKFGVWGGLSERERREIRKRRDRGAA